MSAHTRPCVGLGDRVERALQIVGITPQRVERLLGRPCKCLERKQKLNTLGRWASRVLRGKTDNAETYLNNLLED